MFFFATGVIIIGLAMYFMCKLAHEIRNKTVFILAGLVYVSICVLGGGLIAHGFLTV